jgi:hypothetical protein
MVGDRSGWFDENTPVATEKWVRQSPGFRSRGQRGAGPLKRATRHACPHQFVRVAHGVWLTIVAEPANPRHEKRMRHASKPGNTRDLGVPAAGEDKIGGCPAPKRSYFYALGVSPNDMTE